jgi:hypothetical protein
MVLVDALQFLESMFPGSSAEEIIAHARTMSNRRAVNHRAPVVCPGDQATQVPEGVSIVDSR